MNLSLVTQKIIVKHGLPMLKIYILESRRNSYRTGKTL